MLIDFEVENFHSYREPRKFSLVASSSKELPENLTHLDDLDLNLVRTAAIYGPNASGKSNLLAAMNFVADVLEFPSNQRLLAISSLPFALDKESASKPTKFNIKFTIDSVLYEYNLSIKTNVVDEERLAAYPHGSRQVWFNRKGDRLDFNQTHFRGQKKALQAMTPRDTPLLAVAFAFDHPQLAPPALWLKKNLSDRFEAMDPRFQFPPRRSDASDMTARMCLHDKAFNSWANDFLRHADLGIQRIKVSVSGTKSRQPVTELGPDGTGVSVVRETAHERHHPFFVHSGEEGVTALFDMGSESQGTRRLFGMLVPLYEVLRDGELALVDELNASIHPSLVRELIRVFHDPLLNTKGAQLVFATHDTSLLSARFFRRDQVWFTEKNPAGATDLYSLQDIKGVREDEPFEKGYLRGRYGAIPFFGQFDFPAIPALTPGSDEVEAQPDD